MKKMLSLGLVLLAAAAGGVIYAAAEIIPPREQVVITRTDSYGDPVWAQDAEVTLDAQYDNSLFWTTVYREGQQPSAETDFHPFAYPEREDTRKKYEGLTLDKLVLYGFNNTDQAEMADIFRDFLEEIPVGEERTKMIYLRNYYEYYLFQVYANIAGTVQCMSSNSSGTEAEPGSWEYVNRKLQDYLRIPVLPNDVLQITTVKNAKGEADYTYCEQPDIYENEAYDTFSFNVVSAVTDEALYFTFDPHTTKGKQVDTGSIPGGYGIYRIPYTVQKEYDNLNLQVDEIRMVYALDPGTVPAGLYTNEEQDKLLVLEMKEEKALLSVIDLASGKTLQVLELGSPDAIGQVFDMKKFLVIQDSEDCLSVIDLNERGEYEIALKAKSVDPQGNSIEFSSDAAVDWDGEKLVLCDELNFNAYLAVDLALCSFYMTVFAQEDLKYLGTYRSSLDITGLQDNGGYCWFYPEEPIHVKWIEQ